MMSGEHSKSVDVFYNGAIHQVLVTVTISVRIDPATLCPVGHYYGLT